MKKPENSGFLCEYYLAPVVAPQRKEQAPYVAECEDVIQALELTFDEACEFKSIWRRGRGRQGFQKAESTPVRDASKALHYARRVYALELRKADDVTRNGFDEARIDIIAQNGNNGEHYTRYPWDRAPDWAQWAATDMSGISYWHDHKPDISWGRPAWGPTNLCKSIDDCDTHGLHWTNSLEARPNADV